MSVSDFSISSPRKDPRKSVEKSLTYDEDFENFLNEVKKIIQIFCLNFKLKKIKF